MKCPFALCTSVDRMKQITEVPDRELFTDALSNSKSPISQKDYDAFREIWHLTGAISLLQLIWIYGSFLPIRMSHLIRLIRSFQSIFSSYLYSIL